MADRIDNNSDIQLPDLTRLIRSIQRIEGNPDCFGTAEKECDRLECAWLEFCVKETKENDTDV